MTDAPAPRTRRTLLMTFAIATALLLLTGATALGVVLGTNLAAPNHAPTSLPEAQADNPPPRPEWVFIATPQPSAVGSKVTIILARLQGDANESHPNASIPIEVIPTTWNPLNITPDAQGSILDALNEHLTTEPSLGLTRATLSRAGDGIELVVPTTNQTAVIVYAPATDDFIVIDWATGQSYWWATRAWQPFNNERPWLIAAPPSAPTEA